MNPDTAWTPKNLRLPSPTVRAERVTASTPARFELPAVTAAGRSLARGWLWLALGALLGSGLFSVLLVLARTPGINAWLPAGDFFRVALVVHVDLSVLVWFVAIAGLLWSLNQRPPGSPRSRLLLRAPLWLCGLGALGMGLAAFVDPGEAVMANYIPMLDSAGFRAALWVFAAGALWLVLLTMARPVPIGPAVDGTGALRFGLHAGAVAAPGTAPAIGHRKVERMNSTPTVLAVTPVLPPSSMPEALSTYAVVVEVPTNAPNIAASPSIEKVSRARGMSPSASR